MISFFKMHPSSRCPQISACFLSSKHLFSIQWAGYCAHTLIFLVFCDPGNTSSKWARDLCLLFGASYPVSATWFFLFVCFFNIELVLMNEEQFFVFQSKKFSQKRKYMWLIKIKRQWIHGIWRKHSISSQWDANLYQSVLQGEAVIPTVCKKRYCQRQKNINIEKKMYC